MAQENQAEANGKQVMIFDGMALLFRGYFATSYGGYIRRTKDGVPTNAIYGFLQYFFDAIHRFGPTHVICCWDAGAKTFRSELYGPYKANRPDAPADLVPQFSLVKDVVADLGVPNIEMPGFEADDCIGTLAGRLAEESSLVRIVTGDHDMLQLVSERVHVAIMKKGKSNYTVYDPKTLWEERQLEPLQVIDVKGLMGDTSDNYPGVKGIGEKIAHQLIRDHRSVDGVVEQLSSLPKGVRAKIEADLDMLHLCRDLARIRLDAPVSIGLEECVWQVQRESIMRRLDALEMPGLAKLIG